MSTDYTTLSLAEIAVELTAMARDADAAFGALDNRQINWRPDATRWSIGQCVDHVLSANGQMFAAMAAAMDDASGRTFWQRLPLLPRAFGAMLIRSQSPDSRRKYTAPRKARPATSAIDPRIIERFVAYQEEAAARVRALEGRDVARIMVSPFAAFITYSVLDGCRIVAAHQRRHVDQARRVMREPRFPPAQEPSSEAHA